MPSQISGFHSKRLEDYTYLLCLTVTGCVSLRKAVQSYEI